MLCHCLVLASTVGLALASPVNRWYHESLGANYFQTNGFLGNQLVSSYILPDGTLVAGTAEWTHGNGSAAINDPSPFENHPDPFLSSGSVIVVGKQVLVTNAGSNTFSAFDIDPTDPARPTYSNSYPSGYEFPNSLGASPDGKYVCVLNAGSQNGFICYESSDSGWQHMPTWDRTFGLNLTTPPHGPVGGTPSQITFASDSSRINVAIKGHLPTDLNNPTGNFTSGAIYAFMVTSDAAGQVTLADKPVVYDAGLPFGLLEDMANPGVFFAPDPSAGYEAFDFAANASVAGTVPNQVAVCWAAQSNLTNSFYVVDIGGKANITEIAIDSTTLQGEILSQHSLGTNASGTDVSIFAPPSMPTENWMYVNAAAYESVHAYRITAPGTFSLFQRYRFSDQPKGTVSSKGFAGQAVYYKA